MVTSDDKKILTGNQFLARGIWASITKEARAVRGL
jgi:hypothetical protein